MQRMLWAAVLGAALCWTFPGSAVAGGGSSKPSTTARPPGQGNQTTGQPEATPVPAAPAQQALTGSYQSTINGSVLGRPLPSLGHRLNLSYAPRFGGSFDSRFEYYIDGSYNADPPGQLLHNINEPKFEAQLMYNRSLNTRLGVTGGLLYHKNFRFPDEYGWAITGLTYTLPLGRSVTLSSAALAEKRLSGGRLFYDLSGTLEYRFASNWNTQVSYHRYENQGEFDSQPTQKQEYEVGINRALSHKQTVGVSFFRHIQFGAPNDQFSFLKLKWAVGF